MISLDCRHRASEITFPSSLQTYKRRDRRQNIPDMATFDYFFFYWLERFSSFLSLFVLISRDLDSDHDKSENETTKNFSQKRKKKRTQDAHLLKGSTCGTCWISIWIIYGRKFFSLCRAKECQIVMPPTCKDRDKFPFSQVLCVFQVMN